MRSLPPNIHEHQHGNSPPPPGWMFKPADDVLPLLRWPLGYDIAHPAKALPLALLLGIFGFLLTLFYAPARIGADWFFGFVALSFLASLAAFCRRAIGQRRGEEIHTQEAGYSFITRALRFVPPAFSEQILTPAALAWAGWVMAHAPLVYWGVYQGRTYYEPVSVMLGWWLFISAFSYLGMARWEYRMRWAQTREIGNQTIRAKTFEQRLDTQERQAASRPARSQSRATRAMGAANNTEPDIAELGS
jgi:hypothetical protein